MGTVRGEVLIAQSFQRETLIPFLYDGVDRPAALRRPCLDLGMQGIYVRHEQAAAMMAHAYAG